MARPHRLSTIGALIVCLMGTEWSGTLAASELEALRTSTITTLAKLAEPPASTTDVSAISPWSAEAPAFTVSLQHDELASIAPGAPVLLDRAAALASHESASLAQRGRYRGRGRGGRNAGPAAAIVLGAVASVAGAAVLVYANRPDCRTNPRAEACGYGTKVIGGAVLTGGLVGIVAGALTWR